LRRALSLFDASFSRFGLEIHPAHAAAIDVGLPDFDHFT
jgi:hypothetical protein